MDYFCTKKHIRSRETKNSPEGAQNRFRVGLYVKAGLGKLVCCTKWCIPQSFCGET